MTNGKSEPLLFDMERPEWWLDPTYNLRRKRSATKEKGKENPGRSGERMVLLGEQLECRGTEDIV